MSHKFGILFIVVLLSSQIGLLAFNYYSYATRPEGEFYGSLPNQTAFILTPLKRPNVSTKALLSWATIAATATFTLDFVNYENNLKSLKDYFTESGYQNFLNALAETSTLKTIEEKKLVLSAVAIGTAVISQEYEKSGVHSWTVEVPITVTYISVSAEEKREKLISMTITQVPTHQASKGIGISKYVATDLSPDIMG
jgi:intracellular multiplication protein IcmL